MKLSVVEERENPALQRRELRIAVDYEGGPTPPTRQVGEELARQLGVAAELVEVRQLLSATGAARGEARAHVWASAEARESARPKKRAKQAAAGLAETAKA